jgi:hypothetical protein
MRCCPRRNPARLAIRIGAARRMAIATANSIATAPRTGVARAAQSANCSGNCSSFARTKGSESSSSRRRFFTVRRLGWGPRHFCNRRNAAICSRAAGPAPRVRFASPIRVLARL